MTPPGFAGRVKGCKCVHLKLLEESTGNQKDTGLADFDIGVLQLDVILYSDTEKALFDREKSNLLGYIRAFGPQTYRPEWNIIQQNLGQQREKYLTEQERFQRLLTENENFIDLSSRIGLNLI